MNYTPEYSKWLLNHYRQRLAEETRTEAKRYLREQIYLLTTKTDD